MSGIQTAAFCFLGKAELPMHDLGEISLLVATWHVIVARFVMGIGQIKTNGQSLVQSSSNIVPPSLYSLP